MQFKKQQLEPDIEKLIGSKLGKEYWKVYCHLAYLNSMQSISLEMPGRMTQKMESRCLREISIISDIQMIHYNGRKQRVTKELLDEEK